MDLGLVHGASCVVVYSLVGSGARRVVRTRLVAAKAMIRLFGTAW